MEFGWLEDFLALAEHGSFSRAAEHRRVSQSAFSRRIRMLEAWIGVTLVNRDTHRVALTPAGEEWKSVCEELLRSLAQGRDRTREMADGAASTIRFASTHALSMTLFPGWFDGIEPALPDRSSISLVTDNMVGCERLMLLGQAHLLLCHHHPSSATALSERQFTSLDIGEDRLTPVSAPDGAGQALYRLPGSRSRPVSYLAYSDRSGMGRILEATGDNDRPAAWLAPVFTAHVATVLASMARSGRGLAWLPASLIAGDLEAGRLVRAGEAEWDTSMTVRLYRPRARQNPSVEALWEAARGLNAKRGP
ncbi:MAG: DNA-binding transcriptional LysR family regulator [Brevundimonas sp.]|jgi:DNA-binding transcriptional LysR family regulator|uniref:LysR family transcriptional regulator n=1 Tax=Brevundimonas sp. TaxID=1871086 RepID=UPI0039E24C66